MSDAAQQGCHEMLSDALEHLRKALHLLDLAEAAPQIGARVDHAIHEIYLLIAKMTAGSGLTQIDRNAEPQ